MLNNIMVSYQRFTHKLLLFSNNEDKIRFNLRDYAQNNNII